MMRKFKKWTAVLLTAICVLGAASSAYADGPSGPSSDTAVAANTQKKAGPAGPAAEINAGQAAQNAGQAEQTGDQAAQNAGQAEQAGGQAAQNAGQAEQTGGQAAQNAGQAEQAEGQAAQNAGQAEQTGDQAAQNAGQAEQAGGQPEQSTEGLVLSGGRYLDPSKPMVALTFDDGPYAPVGNRIMDSLEQYNGRSTFFVVGNRVSSYRTEILRMHNNGHEIGNHTYEHKYLNKLNAAQIRYQVEQCNQAVAAVTGEAPKLVRLPGGNKNNTVLANVKAPIIMWSIDTLDWKTRNAEQTVQAVLGKVKDGDVVLMHELYTQSGDAAVTMIPALVNQGYQLVTVSELARFRGGVKSGGVYSCFYR